MHRAVRLPVASILLLLASLVCTTFCYSQTNRDSKGNLEIPRTIDELTAVIDSLMREYEIPGIGVALVSRDSIIWMGGIGMAHVEKGEPVTINTHFRLGSCTKSFLGLGFLKLIEEGKMDINMPVKDIIPEIEIDNPWKNAHPVRIAHLLGHTAGFDDAHLNALYNKDDPEMPLRQALDAKTSVRRVRWQPGTRYSYSSPGYTLAGYILEKATGQQYEDYLKEVILEPIGMKSSSFRFSNEEKHLLSVGYETNYEPIPYFDGFDRPASSLSSSTMEMALFVHSLLNEGRVGKEQVISRVSIDRLGKPTTTIASEAGLMNGYNFGVGVSFQDGFKWFGHSGGGPGCIARYAYTQEPGLGYVILANRFCISEFGKIKNLVQGYLIRDVDPPIPPPSVSISEEQLKQYSGYYEFRSSRQQLVRFLDIMLGGTTISLQNDTLYQQDFMSARFALIPISSEMFRLSNEPEASRIFTMTPEGKMVFSVLGSYYEKTGRFMPFVCRVLFFGALIIMISAIGYALFWIPVKLYKKLTKKENRSKYLRMRVMPLLAILSLVFGIIVVMNQSLVTAGTMTINNIVFFISTLLFAALSILSLVFAIISFTKPVKMVACIYAVVLSLACFGMTLYLSYWGIIGLRVWAY